MRHTNVTTTTKYLRAMHERLKKGISGLEATLGASQDILGAKNGTKQHSSEMAEVARMWTTQQNIYGKIGGGGRSRTYDAADMSREDWDESY